MSDSGGSTGGAGSELVATGSRAARKWRVWRQQTQSVTLALRPGPFVILNRKASAGSSTDTHEAAIPAAGRRHLFRSCYLSLSQRPAPECRIGLELLRPVLRAGASKLLNNGPTTQHVPNRVACLQCTFTTRRMLAHVTSVATGTPVLWQFRGMSHLQTRSLVPRGTNSSRAYKESSE